MNHSPADAKLMHVYRMEDTSLPRSYIYTDGSEETDKSDVAYIISADSVPPPPLWDTLKEKSQSYVCKPQPVRRLKSKGALLLLGITCLIDISYNGALGAILGALLTDVFHYEQAGVAAFLGITVVRSLPQLSYPIAGWLADVHYGRYKVIVSGLWLMLVGYVFIFVTFLIMFFYTTQWGMYVAYLGVFPLAFLTINSGMAAFNANVIPFGLDQMPGASTEQLSAFVHWYYAARNVLAGVIPLIPCFFARHDLTFIVHSVAEFACVLLALILVYGLKRWLIIEPRSENPFRTLYKVLKFASQHKVPILRSSFTYWEEKLPKRIDLGKMKYGGPFSTEKVEDVKTVLRISVVLLALFGYVVGYYLTLLVGELFTTKLRHVESGYCTVGYLLLVEFDTLLLVGAVIIHELIIRPLFNKYIPSMLKRIGIGLIVSLLGTVTLLLMDVYGYRRKINVEGMNSTDIANETVCYIVNGETEELLDLPSTLVTIPFVLVALSEALVFIAVLEFITAQSPYSMRGVLIGILYSIRGFFAFVGGLLILAFSLGYEYFPWSMTAVSCGVPLHVVTLVVGIFGLVCYVMVARRYKNRVRDENVNTQAIVENYYNCMLQSRFVNNNQQ